MIRVKKGVDLSGLRPEILLAIVVADSVYARHGEECVVTSVREGTHGRGSLHFVGLAVDFRTKRIDPDKVRSIAEEIGSRLGAQYDVVLKPNHIHVEFQPKVAL